MESCGEWLRQEYLSRRERNSSYSIRAFARDLELSQPFLSQIISGKRKLASDRAERISAKLGLRAQERRLFVNLARLETAKIPEAKTALRAEVARLKPGASRFSELTQMEFEAVADWVCFAILELTAVKGFRADAKWLSRRLGIPESTAHDTLERVKRVGLLIEKSGRWVKAKNDYIFAGISSRAIRRHHHQSLDLAHQALEQQKLDEREFFTVTIPTDPRLLKTAKKRIARFCEDFTEEMEACEDPTSVYKLSVQYYRLDKGEK